MGFLNFLLYVLAGAGLSHILADASILAPFKFWLSEKDTWLSKKALEMMNCYQCNGFWSGLIVAILGFLGWTWLLWAFAISLVSPLFGYFKLYLAMLTASDNYEEEDND